MRKFRIDVRLSCIEMCFCAGHPLFRPNPLASLKKAGL
jgi:hypothetical protein